MTNIPSFPFARTHTYHPPPQNRELREQCPVSLIKLYDGSDAYIVMKHKDCCSVLDDSEHFSADRRSKGYPEIHPGGHKAKSAHPTFVNLDDPDHSKQRAMLDSFFSQKSVDGMRPMIQHVIDSILDGLLSKHQASNKPVDLVEEFAVPVPTTIIYKVLGVPAEDIPKLSHDSEIRNSTSRNAAETSNDNLNAYMRKLVQARIAHPGKPSEDVINKLVVEQYSQGNLSEDDLVTLAFLVLTAGNAAMINTIALGVLSLLQHPDQLKYFKSDLDPQGETVKNAVDEILRYHVTSALNSRRACLRDTSVAGVGIPAGSGVICSVQSGNRDGSAFDGDPEVFDIRRGQGKMGNGHQNLGFGHGPHRCQGEWLSRTETEIALATLFKRMPGLRLAKTEEELDYSPATQNVGVEKLPVYLQ